MNFNIEKKANEIPDDKNHFSKNSSWKSLQDLKKLTRSMNKSSSQIINPIKPPENKAIHNNSSSSYLETKTVHFKEPLPKEKQIEKPTKNDQNISEIRSQNEILPRQKENFQIKFENLLKLYEKKCMENDKLVEENDSKESLILNLNFALKRANEQITSLNTNNNKNVFKNSSQSKIEIQSYLQPCYKIEGEIELKNKIIEDLKYEIVKLNKKNLNQEAKLEKTFISKLDEEMKKYKKNVDAEIKETFIKKERELNELKNENDSLKAKIKELQRTTINIEEHEGLLLKLKIEIKEQYEGIIEIITKDFSKKLSEHINHLEKSVTVENNNNKLTSKSRIDPDFDTFSIKKEAVINCDTHLINSKLEEDDEHIINDEIKINNFSNVNLNINTKKYL